TRLPIAYAQAILGFRRSIQRACQFIQWHAAEVAYLGLAASDASGIDALLDELFEMDLRLKQLEQLELQSWEDRRARSVLLQAEQVADKVREIERTIENSVATIAESEDAASQRRAEALLVTGVATGPQRAALLQSIQKSAEAPVVQTTSASWDAVVEHLQLEIRLAQLVDDSARDATEFDDFFGPRATLPQDDEGGRRRMRRLGAALQEFYASLPGRIAQHRRSPATGDGARIAEKMAAVVHYRDASSLNASMNSPHLRHADAFCAARVVPPKQLSVAAPPLVSLSTDEWSRVNWRIETQNVRIEAARVQLESFDQTDLQIRFPGDEQMVVPSVSRSVPLNSLNTFQLEVKARRTSRDSADARSRRISLRFTFLTDS
ncbi:MAG: hypothetical protein AAF961_18650, partial [Planctomycetota bacterium]